MAAQTKGQTWSKSHLFLNVLELEAIALAQIFIFVFACSFLGEELYHQCISFNSTLTRLIQGSPKVSTTVVTLIATALSLASSALFSLAIKEAMRHKMRSSTRLIEVSAGAALTKGSHILMFGCWRYVVMTALTWCIFGLFKLLTTGWTTLLMPTLVDCTFDVTGTQLDLANSAFTQLLNTELSVYSNLQIHDDSFPIIDIGSSLSGISAAGTNFGLPGILNFNGARYNISTGGILPAMPGYTGSTEEPGANYTRMSFAGGEVLVNTTILPDVEAGGWAQWFGVQRNYSVYQQGVTANVSCTLATESGYQMNLSSNFFPLPVPSQSQPYYVWAWESSAICNGGSTSMQQYLLLANSTNQADVQGSGFLPSVICPGQRNPSDETFQKFLIATQGYYKYSFLPSTVCEVTPLLTTVLVSYSSGIIDASNIVDSRPFDNTTSPLLLFIAGIANYEGRQVQGTLTNSIGDALYSIYIAGGGPPIENNTQQVYQELESYWRGVVEFSATFLRSGYSADGAFQNGIPSNMTAPINGTVWMLTMGWANRGALYLFSVLPLGLVTILTVLASAYSIFHLWDERKESHTKRPFDLSNPLHLITVSAAGGLTGKLDDFSKRGMRENEGIMVKLEEHEGNIKELVVVPGPSVAAPSAEA